MWPEPIYDRTLVNVFFWLDAIACNAFAFEWFWVIGHKAFQNKFYLHLTIIVLCVTVFVIQVSFNQQLLDLVLVLYLIISFGLFFESIHFI
jgi:hypothetical protein